MIWVCLQTKMEKIWWKTKKQKWLKRGFAGNSAKSARFPHITNQRPVLNQLSGVCQSIDKQYLKALVFCVYAFKGLLQEQIEKSFLFPISDDADFERRTDGATENDAMELGTLIETHQMTFTYPSNGARTLVFFFA